MKAVGAVLVPLRMPARSITVIIATCKRKEQLLITLGHIIQCDPQPAEILVHVDANDTDSVVAVEKHFPNVRVLLSKERIGPGGGRNKLLAASRNELVASFDDDSFPMDSDYFARTERVFATFPNAAVVGTDIYHQNEPVRPANSHCEWVADFVGCGCAYRREAFEQTAGYVPLALAYGMEEVDMALRLHDLGQGILHTHWLRVRHDTSLRHRENPAVIAASISNLFLLAYLRYPVSSWQIGLAQVANRVWWLLRHDRRRGILAGFIQAPRLIRQYKSYRATIPVTTLQSYLRLRRNPVFAGTVGVHLAARSILSS